MTSDRILIFSDSHGHTSFFEEAYERHTDVTRIIFLGDGLRDFDSFLEFHPDLSYEAVAGNCDFFPVLSGENCVTEKIILCSRFRAYLCHGHTCHVKYGMEEAEILSSRLNSDFFFFGHTHEPSLFDYTDPSGHTCTFFNPGSLQDRSYGIMEIKDGKPSLMHLSL